MPVKHADAGTPVHVLQGLMGHASITTTREFYLQTAEANEREALAKYQALLDASGGKTCVWAGLRRDRRRPAFRNSRLIKNLLNRGDWTRFELFIEAVVEAQDFMVAEVKAILSRPDTR